MLKLFNALKKNLVSQQQHQTFRQYNPNELKLIAMRTRLLFEQIYKRQSKKISEKDSNFKKVQLQGDSLRIQYEILEQIGRKVIEVQTIKLYIEFLRKIESYSPQIINTKGDVSLMKEEIKWFQVILWYRKQKKLTNIEEFNTFCYNFFKGVDITAQINPKCQIFKIYPYLMYIREDKTLPMDIIIQKCIPFVSFKIQSQDLNEMKSINIQKLKNEQLQQKIQKQNQFSNQIHKQNINTNNQYPNQYSNQNAYIDPNTILHPHNINFIKKQNNLGQFHSLPQNNENNGKDKSLQNNNEHNTQFNQKSPFEIKKVHYKVVDDQFAIDPYSNIHPIQGKAKITIGTPNQQYPSKSQNKFQSPNLNLIDWEALYCKKNLQNQKNPYQNITQTQKRAYDSYSENSSQYDQNTLPYPPSGVIRVTSRGKSGNELNKNQNSLQDSLEYYQPYPIAPQYKKQQEQNDITFQIKSNQFHIEKKQEEPSFIKNIQHHYFENRNQNDKQSINKIDGINSQVRDQLSKSMQLLDQCTIGGKFDKKNSQTFNQYKSFNQEQLLNEILTQKSSQQNPRSQKKSLNRMFGFKLKNQSIQQNQIRQIEKKYHGNFQQKETPKEQNIKDYRNKEISQESSLTLTYSENQRSSQNIQLIKGQTNQIDRMLESISFIANDDSLKQIDSSVKKCFSKKENQQKKDQMEQFLNKKRQEQNFNKLKQLEAQQQAGKFYQIQDLHPQFSSKKQSKQHSQLRTFSNSQIKIENENQFKEKIQIKKGLPHQYSSQENLNIAAELQKNIIEYQQNKITYMSLNKDLLESLFIIKKCFNGQTQDLLSELTIRQSQKQKANTSFDLDKTKNMQKTQQIINNFPIKNNVKKPYMVSIYARKQFMQKIKNNSIQ